MAFVDLKSDWKNNTLSKLVERREYRTIYLLFIFYMIAYFIAGFIVAHALIKGGYL
jgi:hypothetical protein